MQINSFFKEILVLERNVIVLTFTSLIGSFGNTLWINILSLYIYGELHAEPLEVGIAFTIGNIVAAVFMFPVGYISEKIGKKRIIIIMGYLLFLTTFLFAFARNWVEFVPILFLYNIAMSYQPVMLALIADSLRKSKRASGFAFFWLFLQ